MLGPLYGVGNMLIDNFVPMFLMLYAQNLAHDFMAHAVSAIAPNELIGLLVVVMYWFTGFMFMGMMVDFKKLLFFLWPMQWCFPVRWVFATLVHIEMAWTPRV